MRRVISWSAVVLSAVVLGACTDYVTDTGDTPNAPTGLTYELQPSGDPLSPQGIILRWTASGNPNLAVYNVYSRASSSAPFDLRGSTTSPSFHDDGAPDLEYYVTAEGQNKQESDPSQSVVVDERLRLPAPAALTSISLNTAIHLSWTDNAFTSDPSGFWHYRVYSTTYDLDNDQCGTNWTLEGTTVAPAFLSAALPNGKPRCFGVSAVSIEGFESLWSPLRQDTPRFDATTQIVYTNAGDPTKSGFRFFLDNGDGQASPLELGLISSGASPSVDFTVTKDVSGNLQLTPVRTGTTLRTWNSGAVIANLSDIDFAPLGGYARTPLTALPGHGYVFQTTEGSLFAYGAVRVVALGPEYVILDWSYQSDIGNPELVRAR
jgi:hypothetical protein